MLKSIFHFSLFAIHFCLPTITSAQVNYKNLRSEYLITCKRTDSASVIKSQKFLDSLSQYPISEGRDWFLYDLGMTYYIRYAKWKDVSDIRKSLSYFEEGFRDYQSSDFAWHLTLYNEVGECGKSLEFLDKFLTLRKKEGIEIDYEQVYKVHLKCCK